MAGTTLTPFQIKSRLAIEALFEEAGTAIDFQLGGVKETFLVAVLPSLTLWIYEDELGMKGVETDRMLEAASFESQDEMLEYFLSELSLILKRSAKN